MTREPPQVNVRLSDTENKILRAAAFVKDRSKKDLAKEAVLLAIERYAKEESVQAAMEAREIEETNRKAPVTQIDARRRRKGAKKKRG
jgi:hypothetical protein